MKAAKPIASTKRAIQTFEPGFTLHKLNPDDFHEAVGLVERVKTAEPDSAQSPVPHLHVGARVMAQDANLTVSGVITGFAVDGDSKEVTKFARVSGRLYHASTLKRA